MKIGYLMQVGVADMFAQPLSGPANHVHHVCRELRAMGHDVRLLFVLHGRHWLTTDGETYTPVALPLLEKGPLRLFERAARRIQSELRLPFAGLFDTLRFVAACRRTLGGCDIFLERMGWMGYGGALTSRLMGIPLVLEVNGDHLAELEMLGMAPRGAQKRLSMRLTGFSARAASHVVATGEGWRRRFIDRWETPAKRVSVIENGTEVVGLLDRPGMPAFANGRPALEEVTAVYIGGFEPWHGLATLLEAFAAARSRGARLRLLLIGDGSERLNLLNLIEQLEIGAFVTLTGPLRPPEFARHLQRAEIGLSPYCGRVEYSGLKLLDYKAAGLATIASGAHGEPAVIRDGETGRIVPPCSVADLAAALEELAEDHALRRAMGRRARLEAEAEHSWRRTAEELVRCFEEVLTRG